MSSSAVKGTKTEIQMWKFKKFKDEKLYIHLLGGYYSTNTIQYHQWVPLGREECRSEICDEDCVDIQVGATLRSSCVMYCNFAF